MQTRIHYGFLFLVFSQIAHAKPAEKPQIVRPEDSELMNYAPDKTEIETRLDADLTGDGLMYTVFIANSEERRVLIVMAAYADEFDMGFERVGQMELETFPLGKANLRFQKGVLTIEDLTGGTTAINALYRYRFDKAANKMRLIGDDLTQYSRTNQHDSIKVSTNRLTGKSVSQVSKLKGEDYIDQPAITKTVSSKAIYMEDTPNPCIALGCMDQ